MSGIIPPSILTMQYAVDSSFKRYVNLSFPFRVKIEKVWFTADDGLSGRGYAGAEGGNPYMLDRLLRLGAVKQRNASTVGNSVTDLNLCWAAGFNWYGPSTDLVANDKPSIWFGFPDARDEVADDNSDTPEQEVQSDGWWDTDNVYRSTARSLPSVDRMSYWYNEGWDETEFNADKYKTDLSVLNSDEILSLFVYNDDGDWTDYVDGSGIVTIFVQYSGIGGPNVSSPTRIWD